MDELIWKQEAIDALYHVDEYNMRSVEAIRNLPSIQQKIIHCKDCKHHWVHRCMDSIPTEICDLNQTFYDADVDFCSMAEKRGGEDDETDCDYERAVEQLEHDMLYEPTFNPDDGSM